MIRPSTRDKDYKGDCKPIARSSGKTAYEIAVEQGFIGSEIEWIKYQEGVNAELSKTQADRAESEADRAQSIADIVAQYTDEAEASALLASQKADIAVDEALKAENSAVQSEISNVAAGVKAGIADTRATDADQSATAAALSETNSKTSETNSALSESAAAASAAEAALSESSAASSATTATDAEVTVLGYMQQTDTYRQQAEGSATQAAASEQVAITQADIALVEAARALTEANRAEDYANAMANGLSFLGLWDASNNTLPEPPSIGSAQWKISADGVLNGTSVEAGDTLLYSNVSGNFLHLDTKDRVTSVNGRIGPVTGLAEASDIAPVGYSGSYDDLTNLPTLAISNWNTAYAWGDHAQQNYAYQNINVNAGLGMSGGGTLASDFTLTMGTPSTISSSTTNAVSETSHTHALEVTAADVGLGSVDNTADADKPVSTATAAALAEKTDTTDYDALVARVSESEQESLTNSIALAIALGG